MVNVGGEIVSEDEDEGSDELDDLLVVLDEY